MSTQSYGTRINRLSNGQLVGAGLVVGIHIVFLWALQSGVAQKSFEKIKNTVEAKIIIEPKVEVKPEPPKIEPKVEIKPKLEPKVEPKSTPPKPVELPKVAPPPIVETAPVIAAVPSSAPSPIVVPAAVVAQPAAVVAQPATPPVSAPVAVSSPPKAVAKTGATLARGSCEEPDYPPVSARAREEGSVLLEFTVSPEGKVVQSKVLSSSGFPRLDEAAKAAYSKCKFSPATSDGQAVQGSTKVRYNWTLTE
jgi:periplasmic protein TonB